MAYAPGENLSGWKVTNFSAMNGKFVASLETQAVFDNGIPTYRVVYHTYYIISSTDCQNWDYSQIGEGIEYFDTVNHLKSNSTMTVNDILWNGTSYNVLTTQIINNTPTAGGVLPQFSATRKILSSIDLVTWNSAVLPNTSNWTAMGNNGAAIVIAGDNVRSASFIAETLTNYAVVGGVPGITNSDYVTSETSISYYDRINDYVDYTSPVVIEVTMKPTSYVVSGIELTAPGSGYTSTPMVSITGDGTTMPTAFATINYIPPSYNITGLDIIHPGSGYGPTASLTFTASGPGTGASGTVDTTYSATLYQINGVTLTDSGSGYSEVPSVTISGDGTGATAEAKLPLPITVTNVSLTNAGTGYSAAPTVTISPPLTGSAATAQSTVIVVHPYIITGITVNPGSGYIVPPKITVEPTLNPEGELTGEGLVIDFKFKKSGFGKSIAISDDDQWMYVSAPNIGKIQCYKKVNGEFSLIDSLVGRGDVGFGDSLSTNADGSMLIVSAPKLPVEYQSNVVGNAGTVYVYSRIDSSFALTQVIKSNTPGLNDQFGYSVLVSPDSYSMFISAIGKSEEYSRSGIVYWLTNTSQYSTKPTFVFSQTIRKPFMDFPEHFGALIKQDTRTNALIISSDGASSMSPAMYDTGKMIFDGETTVIQDIVYNSGAVYVYDKVTSPLGSTYVYSQELSGAGVTVNDDFGQAVVAANGTIFVGAPYYDKSSIMNGATYGSVSYYINDGFRNGWSITRKEEEKVDSATVTSIYLYDKDSQQINYEIDYLDPIKGKILGIAEQDISFKTPYDPATYLTANNSSRSEMAWGSEHVGKVWWNTDPIRYIDYEQGDLDYRINNWGKLFPGSTVEVYEWVESVQPPSSYNYPNGGTPYNNGNSYSFIYTTDYSTGLSVGKYYFWVSGKETIDTVHTSRNLSVKAVAQVIASPEQQDIPYAAIIKNNSIALFGGDAQSFVNVDKSIFHIDYAVNRTENLIHNEYELIQENSDLTAIPDRIVSKLIDSLTGADSFGNVVPDYTLKDSEKLGIGIRPRQTMIVNKLAATHNFVQYVNQVFTQYPIAEEFDLTAIKSEDPIPFVWDTVASKNILVETIDELGYVDTNNLVNGQRILVRTDINFDGQWAIYQYVTFSNTFILVQTQSYRTADYWFYTDWYDPTYDYTVKPTYTVDDIKSISKLSLVYGNTVHVRNTGAGLFARYLVNQDLSLTTVGIQNGTIQLSDALWAHDTNKIGFDNDSFDTVKFDLNPTIEFRNIINAIRDTIFTNTLSAEFNKMFFFMMNYILSEQRMVDWAFKTSFVSIVHKLRKLEQYPSYIKDNQTYYQDYINEVKPYRTKIREYLINYSGDDQGSIYATDFDLPSYYDFDLKTWRSPNGEHARDALLLTTNPKYADWVAGNSYSVKSVTVEQGGHGFTSAPTINVVGGGGAGAVLVAVVDFYVGNIVKVNVISPGTGYTSTPTLQILGDGTGAVCYPIMQNLQVRSFDTTLKFDRITYDTVVTKWASNTDYTSADIIAFNNVAYKIIGDTLNSGNFFDPGQYTVLNDAELTSAADRVAVSYQPTAGMPPAILERLFAGTDYPGNHIDGGNHGTKDLVDTDPAIDIDTQIESYFTDIALGTRPEDINIDGGAFVDTYSSHAPEELLPGIIFETLDIQVYTKDDVRPTIGFRMHKPMANGKMAVTDSGIVSDNAVWEFTRISGAATTTLAADLLITDTEISVVDVSKLPEPSIGLTQPGVVFINGEKITYYTRDLATNTLGQIRRGVWGTGAPAIHAAGSKVVDASLEQKLPGDNPGAVTWFNTNGPVGSYNSTTPQALFITASPAEST